MKQTLKDFSSFLLVVLCDYVLGDAEYLLLGEPGHVALSNSSVSVAFQYVDGANGTLWNVSVLLVEASTNRTVATKHLLAIQAQGTLEFECFHFKEAGDYWFTMSPDTTASRPPRAPGGEKHLSPGGVARLSRGPEPDVPGCGRRLAGGAFYATAAVPVPRGQARVEVDVTLCSSLPGASARQGRPLETRCSQRTALAQSQWVEVAAPRWAQQPRSPRCCGSWAQLGHYRRGCCKPDLRHEPASPEWLLCVQPGCVIPGLRRHLPRGQAACPNREGFDNNWSPNFLPPLPIHQPSAGSTSILFLSNGDFITRLEGSGECGSQCD
ncbi:thrombospondin type-1 domain-containing protein 1-like isoform X2 [Dasypus novemcinctus]|uniref:thrombospondin type-1 domain-containing protein 1-like isoform X2 n=1 Tax=Dasypus novemcinctus TaxID=9361 RepID=UPI00265EAF6F|nr:thrombospondin type-1 domain-containing protein 1-like isoform X2 [Dasypus novemcinctus]